MSGLEQRLNLSPKLGNYVYRLFLRWGLGAAMILLVQEAFAVQCVSSAKQRLHMQIAA
jgi:hypothetical protein